MEVVGSARVGALGVGTLGVGTLLAVGESHN